MPPKIGKLDAEFKDYVRAVFKGAKLSAGQTEELRRAFFAGAYTVLCAVEEIGEPHVSDAEGEAWLSDTIEQCQTFKDDLLRDLTKKQ